MSIVKATNVIQLPSTIGQTVISASLNFQGFIPLVDQGYYGTIILMKKYKYGEYEYVPQGLYNADYFQIKNTYGASLPSTVYNYTVDKAFGFLALAIPSVTRLITALGQSTYLSNRKAGEYYIYDEKLWILIDNELSDVYPNSISGNWTQVTISDNSEINDLFNNKTESEYDYYYDNNFVAAPCRIESWVHSQSCVNGKVVVSGVSSFGNTYNVTTSYNCDIYDYSYSVDCSAGYIRIVQTKDTTGEIVYIPTAYPCGQTDHIHDYYVELECAENCKPSVWVSVIKCHLCDFQARYETQISCCDCDDTPTVDYVCDEQTGNLRINIAASECGEAYSLLTNIPCSNIDSCTKILGLTKVDCENFIIRHDDSEKTYYIKIRDYDNPYSQVEIEQSTIFIQTTPRINISNPTYNLDLSDKEDGMYLAYLIWTESVDGEAIGRAVIIPIYKTCSMEACMDKLIKSILCMCDCEESNPCDPQAETQYKYELNKLISIIQPVQQLMMLRHSMDGQVIPYDLSLLQKYYDLGLMIKKMNLMIDRCGLCNETTDDCGCN